MKSIKSLLGDAIVRLEIGDNEEQEKIDDNEIRLFIIYNRKFFHFILDGDNLNEEF